MFNNISKLNEQQRFERINSIKVDDVVLNYLKEKLQNLSIQIGARQKEPFFELMDKGLLEGWCWQTTESSIVFLKDTDFIERGNLKFDPHKNYWHSWICFNLVTSKTKFR